MKLFEYFNLTQIINLPSRNDRRQETEFEFKRYGFPINVEKVTFFNALSVQTSDGFPTAGVKGCFLSHMKVVENAKKLHLKNILIMEDDICFSKNILKYSSTAIQKLENIDWDIAYFGHNVPNSSDEITWKEVKHPMLLAHFYAVNGKTLPLFHDFLESILSRPPGHPEGGPMHYDGAINTFLNQNKNLKAYFFSKNLGYQRPSRTDLHKTPIFDKNFILKIFISYFRKIKKLFFKIIF